VALARVPPLNDAQKSTDNPSHQAQDDPLELPTLPTNTTWTLAKAAVAANISILLAFVAKASTKENMKVKTQTRPSRILTL